MRDLNRALEDIETIRAQLARDTTFRGYGPVTLASTGLLALMVAAVQATWLSDPNGRPLAYCTCWFAAAAVAVGLIGLEAVARSRRLHRRLANEMLYSAIEQFMPPVGAGILLAVVFFHSAPDNVWLLPGLWQVLIGIGVFSASRSLPRAVSLVGGWYVLAGLAVITLASATHALSPWAMGIPFGVGQVLFAAVLHWTLGDRDGEI